jgi:hypothetical protein
MNLWRSKHVWGLSAGVLAAPLALLAQGTPIPLKPGLWEMQVNMGSPGGSSGAPAGMPALPPDAEAKIAALPPAQQAQVRAAMAGAYGGGAGAGKPAPMTTQACLTANTTMDSLLSRSQQGGMQCTYSNKVQTAHGASFDMSCTGPMGKAQGHTEFKMPDDEHMSSTIHLTMTGNGQAGSAQSGSGQGAPMTMTRDMSSTGKFVKADCGDVKPVGPPAGPK